MTKYYSRSKQKFIEIANMPDQYVRNAFVKMCKHEPTEDAIYAEQQRERADRSMKLRNDLFEENVELEVQVTELKKQLDNTTYQPYDDQGRVRDYQVEFTKLAKQRDKWKEKCMNMVEKNTYQVMWDNCQVLKAEVDKHKSRIDYLERSLDSHVPKGDVKMFSEIPNTDDGWEFVRLLKKYLNNVSYKLRVRGQYLDDETKKSEGWRRYSFGQPIEKSKCLRVYVDINKEVD